MAGLLAAALLWAVQRPAQSDKIAGVYFQGTSSEHLWQTVSALDLALEPRRSLWYLHIQPPLLDGIRMVAAVNFPKNPKRNYRELLVHVDRWLYRAWALVYVLVVALAGFWLARLTRPWFGVVAALVGCAAHPGLLFYAMFLDSTVLGMFVTLWLSYEVWAMRGAEGSVARVTAATIVAFLARSHFQWPILIVVATALWWRRVPARRIAAYLLGAGLVLSVYMVKQYVVFGLLTTSSFAGSGACSAIRAPCDARAVERAGPDPNAARVLRRTPKRIGTWNWNHIQWLRESFSMTSQFKHYLWQQPVLTTLGHYVENLEIHLEPSSSFARHSVVDRLPWRRAYDRIFSGALQVVLLAGVAAYWLWPRGTRLERLAVALVPLYVSAISVLFEYRENMRYKAFVEPVLVVGLASTVYWLVARARWPPRFTHPNPLPASTDVPGPVNS